MLWIAGPLLYAIVCAFFTLRRVHSFELLELAARYVILLPALWWAVRRPQRFLNPPHWLAVALPFALLAALLSHGVAHGITVTDESAYLFQARIFLTGHVAAEPLPGAVEKTVKTPPELNFEQHISTPREWTTKYYPGWPALLAAFTAVGLEWLVNPLLSLALLGLTFALAQRWFDERTARIAVVLMALSPYLLARSVGFMSDLFCAVLVAGAWLLMSVAEQRRSWLAFAGMFALMALSLLTRPFSAFAVALALGASLLLLLRQNPKRLAAVLILGAGFAGAAYVGLRVYNFAITGDAAVSPYSMARGQKEIREISVEPSVVWTTFLHETRWSLQSTFVNTFPFLFLLAAGETWRRRKDARVVSLALLFPLIAGLEVLQPENSGGVNGERFYLEALFGVAILAAAAIARLQPGRSVALAMTGVQFALLAVSTQAIYNTARPYVRVRDVASSLPLANSIVFLKSSGGFDAFHDNFNSANWRQSPVIYLIDPGAERRGEVARRFERSHYAVVTYDGASDRGRVLETK